MSRTDLDERRAEKQRLEEEHRKKNINKPREDMKQSRVETVVLSTSLKDNKANSWDMMVEEEEDEDEEVDLDDYDRFTEEEEDEEVAKFSF